MVKGRYNKAAYAQPMKPKRNARPTKSANPGSMRTKVAKEVSPARVHDFITKVIETAIRGKSPTAVKFLTEISKPFAFKVADSIVKLVNAPASGVTAPEGTELPLFTKAAHKRISGKNHLYTAKEYKVKFTSGKEPGSWLKGLKRTNGNSVLQLNDTTRQYPLESANRSKLVTNIGFNQKLQTAISTDLFGFTFSSLKPYFGTDDFDSSHIKEQIAYGAVSNLQSRATITSLNRYVPTYVKMNLCRIEATSDHWSNAFKEGMNTSLLAQVDGAMPFYWQQNTPPLPDLLGTPVFVDPKTPGIKGAEKFKANIHVVASKTIKLYAGDRIKLDYDHMCGSGIRVDKLHGIDRDTSWDNDHPVTYCLMIESWGEEVDAHSAVSADNIIKGTCTASLQFEFSKRMIGSLPLVDHNNILSGDPVKGFKSTDFAIKVYSKNSIGAATRRYFGEYSALNDPAGYSIPVMSDAFETEAARIS